MIANWKYKSGIIQESYFSEKGKVIDIPRIGVWLGGKWYSGFKSALAAKLFITRNTK